MQKKMTRAKALKKFKVKIEWPDGRTSFYEGDVEGAIKFLRAHGLVK